MFVRHLPTKPYQKSFIQFAFSTVSSNMNKFKVLICNDTVPTIATDILKPEFDVKTCKEDREIIMNNISGIHGLFWASYEIKLDKEILDKAGPQLTAIATMSAGYNNIETEELKKRKIKFGNTPGVVGSAVAEQAIMLGLAAARRLNEGRIAMINSNWTSENNLKWLLGMEISGSTVGIVGLGSIGQAIVKKLKGFEVEKFIYTGHKEKPEGKQLGADFVEFDYLIKNSDFIFSCIPLTKETENLFDYENFLKMKKTAIFVNIGRGGSVNQTDLIRALKENIIFAAGLDVMSPEPIVFDDPLLKLPNCIIAPHLGTATNKTTENMAILTAQNILKALKGESMLTPIF